MLITTRGWTGKTPVEFNYKGKYHSASKMIGRLMFHYSICDKTNRLYFKITKSLNSTINIPT